MDIDYRKIIESRYNRQNWQLLLRDIFKSRVEFWATPYEISTNSPMAKQALWLGTITLSDDETIAIYEVELSDSVDIERNRRGIRDMLLTEWRNRDAGAFMFCYRKTESVLRFSYVSESWNFAEDGTYQKESTDTKRYTYLLGEGHRSRTAIQQFEELKKSDLNLKALTKAFSVEAVSKMFFDEYKKNYEDIIQFITGKRMVKVANKWEEQVKNEPCEAIMQEFSHFPDPEKSVRDYVKKLMGRLVFLQFLQKKGWLGVKNGEWGSGDAEFLQTLYKNCDDKDHFVDKVLEELFNELNTEHDVEASHFKVPYLNGGLFEREATDETEFPLPAKYMQQMLDFFASYNFTIDENDPDDAEVGVDPEMLGRIFENLLEDNKDKGAFYTPKEIVTYMCRESLIAYIQTDIEDEATKEAIRQFVTTHEKNDKLPSDIDQKLKDVKICDPAIGSGAFPMGLLKELFQCRTALEGIEQSKAAEIKKHIIQNNIYGVDIERGAVDIARLRFWLSLIVDEENPQALPNLDYKIVEGNSLITTFDGQYIDLEKGKGEARYRPSLINIQKEKKLLQAEQKRFFTLTGDEKYRSEIAIKKHILNTIWYQLDFEKHSWQDATIKQAGIFGVIESKGRKKNTAQVTEFTPERQEVLEKCEALQSILNDENKSLQEKAGTNIPFFEWETVFSDIFDNQNGCGFDIVIGNPPYIQLEADKGKLAHLYEKCGYETYNRKGNIYCLFFERGWHMLRRSGNLCYITLNKWMRADYGKSLRSFFTSKTTPSILVNFGGIQVFENANADTNILLIQKSKINKQIISVELKLDDSKHFSSLDKYVLENHVLCRFSGEESWVVMPEEKRSLKNKIESKGKPLADWNITINYGIKTGYDKAFWINSIKREEILSWCYTEEEREATKQLIKPILRGKDIKKYESRWADIWLIGTFPSRKYDIEKFPAIKRHLQSFTVERLEQSGKKYIVNGIKISSRKKTSGKWFELQDSIAYWEEFEKTKIIYPETTKYIPFVLDDGHYYANKTCFIMVGEHIGYLAAFLNSSLFKYCFIDEFPTLGEDRRGLAKIYFERIPVLEVDNSTDNEFYSLVQDIQKEYTEEKAKYIDQRIFDLYNLTQEERDQIGYIDYHNDNDDDEEDEDE